MYNCDKIKNACDEMSNERDNVDWQWSFRHAYNVGVLLLQAREAVLYGLAVLKSLD